VRDVRLLVASSHPVLREGLRAALIDGPFRVECEAADRDTAVSLAVTAEPDVCLVDEGLAGGCAPAVRDIVRSVPACAVIVLANDCAARGLLDAVRSGAHGYLSKDVDAAGVRNALQAVLAGEAAIPRRLVSGLLAEVRETGATPSAAGATGVGGLTRREHEVLDLMRSGLSTGRIAEELYVSPGTVRSHVMSLMRKLHAPDRAALLGGKARARPRARALVH